MKHPSSIKYKGNTYVRDRKATTRLKRQADPDIREADYQGWKNYETWTVSLLWNNDRGDYEYWNERAQAALDGAEGNKDEAWMPLADEMKDALEDGAENLEIGGMYGQLLSGALDEVDFREVSQNWLSDMEYEGEEDEDEEE